MFDVVKGPTVPSVSMTPVIVKPKTSRLMSYTVVAKLLVENTVSPSVMAHATSADFSGLTMMGTSRAAAALRDVRRIVLLPRLKRPAGRLAMLLCKKRASDQAVQLSSTCGEAAAKDRESCKAERLGLGYLPGHLYGWRAYEDWLRFA